ncbi:MAG TPA: ATP-dependent DNA helicase RecG [Solirubrobacteraceae bacterium]|nr:ATP-dependent DNA helicase RecG [Solirubrobacteraceae bacterium]
MPVANEPQTLAASPASAVARGRSAQRAFASTRTLTRRELLAAPVRWPRPSRLAAELELPSPRMAAGMQALGLRTVGELLEHLPSDRREARTVAALRTGEQATVAVEVRDIRARPVRRRRMRPLVEATVFDATGAMRATFFNQPWLVERYPPGTRLLLHGKASARGGFTVSHHALDTPSGAGSTASGARGTPSGARGAPSWEHGDGAGAGLAAGAGAGAGSASTRASASVAHYPAADGVSSTQILTLVHSVGDALHDVVESLPASTRVAAALPDRASALAAMHFPRAPDDLKEGRRRLAFEELLLAQLVFLRRRAARRARSGAVALTQRGSLGERWLEQGLPFALTGDQRRAVDEIAADLACAAPMQRLLLGEVGSGKTVVALYAMLQAVGHGCQAALMAPTETLAEQHFATIQALLGEQPVSAALLTGSTPARRRADILGKLSSGQLSLIVGTHALIEPDVNFARLAVAVIDEQHRFGVRQRAALEGGEGVEPAPLAPAQATTQLPHTLHMTATPIPRTLALARYGDLDTSTLRELPRGRQPIETLLVCGSQQRAQAYEQVRAELAAGRQAYVVCPLIAECTERGDDEQDGASVADGRARDADAAAQEQRAAQAGASVQGGLRAATAELHRLREGELAGHRLTLMHGGMPAREKQAAMAAFAGGEAQVLVSTTVIEVGIDVPNATAMLIENAERFGISQLHQLRGRVGRGEHRARCYLVAGGAPSPELEEATATGEQATGEGAAGRHVPSGRLRALARYSDGFRLAEIDLAMRKEGELIGTRQSGLRRFGVAQLPQDAQLLELARERARAILAHDPELREPEHTLLAVALAHAHGSVGATPIPA